MGAIVVFASLLKYSDLGRVSPFHERQIQLYTALICLMIIEIPFSLYPGYSFKRIFEDYLTVVLFVFLFYKIVRSVQELRAVLFVGTIGAGLYSIFSLLV